MTDTEAAGDVGVLDGLLQALRRARSESDVEHRLRSLLEACGTGRWQPQVTVAGARPDLVNFQYRVVVETKARGLADPAEAGSRPGSSQRDQLEGYVRDLNGQLPYGTTRPWRGFLTDGDVWWGWEWSDAEGTLAPLPYATRARPVADPTGFSQFVRRRVAPPDRAGAPPPPDPLKPLFYPFLTRLRALVEQVEEHAEFRTKFGLWERVLRGSGLVATGAVGQANAFVEHTVLVVAARLIVDASNNDDSSRSGGGGVAAAVSEGFCAWLTEFPQSLAVLDELADTVAAYDWRTADRDLLKGLYHDLIPRDLRKEFGEYYTPDWLAAQVVDTLFGNPAEHLDPAIRSAAHSLGLEDFVDGPTAPAGAYTVLDPACGSGTFLYWAARAITKRIRDSHRLLTPHARRVVAHMVAGMDIHPVAVEMACATLATALPPGGDVQLRVHTADATQPGHEPQRRLGDTITLESPEGRPVDIPAALVEHPEAARLVDELVDAAVSGHEPDGPFRAVSGDAVGQLTEVIAEEGNHVWRWYVHNQIAPSALVSQRAAAVVGNPPWLVANDTPEGSRKQQLQRLARSYGLWPRGTGSAKADLAAVFSARVTDLYLTDGGVFAFVLPGSAMTAQTWSAWRAGEWRSARISFAYAERWDTDPPPFGHAPNGTSVAAGRRVRDADHVRTLDDADNFWVRGDPAGSDVTTWTRRRSSPSPYASKFQRGAVASPLGLCLVTERSDPTPDGMVTVTTYRSTKGQWKGVTYTATVEEAALVSTLRAQALSPFAAIPDAWLIAPLVRDAGGQTSVLQLGDPRFVATYPNTHRYWTKAEARYQQDRAATAGATLSDNLDRYRTLTKQITDSATYTKVVYNKSGQVLRAARCPQTLVADDKLYWFPARSETEALYLVGVLNSCWLQHAWRESKTSRLHYDLNPLKHVPVPAYDADNATHRRVAAAAQEAETGFDTAVADWLEKAVAALLPDWGPPTHR